MSAFSRIGGKSLLAEEIVSYFPKDYEKMIYVEPFVGAGSVFYKKNISIKEILNDLDKNIYILFQGLKKFNTTKINKALSVLPRTKNIFIKVKNSSPKSQFDKFIKSYYLIKNSFFGLSSSFNLKGNNTNPLIVKDKFNDRLKNVIIENKDYKSIIKKYDTPNTLFYLDPPYEKSESLYRHFNMDYIELASILKKIKGRFILSLNYNKEFIKLFNTSYVIIKTKYADPVLGGQSRNKKELLFYNY